jgi:hypothetical protein
LFNTKFGCCGMGGASRHFLRSVIGSEAKMLPT